MTRDDTSRKRASRKRDRSHLTIAEVCDDLEVARSTFYDWRAKRRAPRCIKLPNGGLRIRRDDYESWLEGLGEDAA